MPATAVGPQAALTDLLPSPQTEFGALVANAVWLKLSEDQMTMTGIPEQTNIMISMLNTNGRPQVTF